MARKKVQNMNDTIPTGPIVVTKKELTKGRSKVVVNLEGSKKYGLSAPDDEKSWVGVYHYVEKVTMELYLFSSQSSTERFINQNSDEKITFEKLTI